MTKSTPLPLPPSPWYVEYDYLTQSIDPYIKDARKRRIAKVYTVSGAEATDYAPLIAAAPTLLSILQTVYATAMISDPALQDALTEAVKSALGEKAYKDWFSEAKLSHNLSVVQTALRKARADD